MDGKKLDVTGRGLKCRKKRPPMGFAAKRSAHRYFRKGGGTSAIAFLGVSGILKVEIGAAGGFSGSGAGRKLFPDGMAK